MFLFATCRHSLVKLFFMSFVFLCFLIGFLKLLKYLLHPQNILVMSSMSDNMVFKYFPLCSFSFSLLELSYIQLS